MSRSNLLSLLAVPLLAVLPGQALATVCVDAAGSGSCFTTIQLGVDNAAAGDTINIKKGVYFENVVIPAALDGLTLKGSSRTILDPGDDSDAATVDNTGNGIEVGSNDVTIQGFTIRNGQSHAIEIQDGVVGTEIVRMRFVHCGDECISSANVGNDDTFLGGNSFFGMDNDGSFELTGNNIEVVKNRILGGDNTPARVTGDDTIFERNTVLMNGNDTECTDFTGDRVEVVKNVIDGCSNEAIEVDGDDALVSGNKIRNSDGIQVDGDNFMIVKNSLIDVANAEGIDADCPVTCDAAVVSGNKMFSGADDVEGLQIDSAGAGITIEKNIVDQFSDDAFDLDILSGTVSKNRAIDSSATESDSCYTIDGDGSTFDKNSAKGCSEGFEINGDNNVFDRNSVSNSAGDAFRVTNGITGTTLNKNTAVNNAGLGFEIADGSTGTTLTDNRAKGNHTDVCDDAAATTASGNRFDTSVANITPGDATQDCPNIF